MSPRTPLLLLTMALPLWAAEEAAGLTDRMPDMGQPGAAAQLTAAAAGLQTPPTAAQLAALPPQEFSRRQAAVKRVWLHRMACANAEQGRVSPQAEAECAGMAREWECPELLAEILQEMAGDTADAPRRYALQETLELLLSGYRIDALQIFYAAKCGNLTPEAADELADMLPLPAVFNMVNEAPRDTVALAADARTQARLLSEAAALLAQVNDAESAAAALPQLMPLLAEAETTQALRMAAAEGKVPESALTVSAMTAYEQALHLLNEQRRRLQTQDWYGNALLRTVDYLLD